VPTYCSGPRAPSSHPADRRHAQQQTQPSTAASRFAREVVEVHAHAGCRPRTSSARSARSLFLARHAALTGRLAVAIGDLPAAAQKSNWWNSGGCTGVAALRGGRRRAGGDAPRPRRWPRRTAGSQREGTGISRNMHSRTSLQVRSADSDANDRCARVANPAEVGARSVAPASLAGDRAASAPEHELLDLAGRGLRQLGHELNAAAP
jgi:hypothetical protein